LLLCWLYKLAHFVTPCLYQASKIMRSGNPLHFGRKKITKNNRKVTILERISCELETFTVLYDVTLKWLSMILLRLIQSQRYGYNYGKYSTATTRLRICPIFPPLLRSPV
jgi:hypothetical protein